MEGTSNWMIIMSISSAHGNVLKNKCVGKCVKIILGLLISSLTFISGQAPNASSIEVGKKV